MEIEKKVLQSNLELLQKCSSTSTNEDVSDKILFYEGGMGNASRGRLMTYIGCEVDFEGVFVIEALLKIVKALSGDMITLEFDGDKLKISSNKSKVTLKPLEIKNWKSKYIEKPLDYIEQKVEAMPDSVPKSLPKEFIIGLQQILQCASNEKNGSILNNVAVIKDELIASDNYKVGRYLITSKFPSSFLIDTYNVQPIIDLNPTEYCLCDDRILLFGNDGANVQMCAISPMGKYPDFSKLLQGAKNDAVKMALPEELSDLVFLAQQIPGKNNDSRIKLAVGKNKLGLAFETMNGWFKQNIRIDYDNTPFEFMMNLDTLSNALKNIGNDIYISPNGTGMMQLVGFSYVFPIDVAL